MLKRSKDKKTEEQTIEQILLKYEKPKILLIDLPSKCLTAVEKAGYNVSSGTFGSPYKVERRDSYQAVFCKPSLPNYTEQEIIFVDLTPPITLHSPVGEKATSEGELDVWCKCNLGEIDPRSSTMALVTEDFDRILDNGGVFVIFAQPRQNQQLVWARKSSGYSGLEISKKLSFDNWSFISLLSSRYLIIGSDFGEEINIPNYDEEIFHFLRKNIKNAKYTATFRCTYQLKEENLIPILYSKFNRCIGGLITIEKTEGLILILPQLSNKPEAIVTLLREVLPELSPHLFPQAEGLRWIERDEYELETVLQYKKEKIDIEEKAKKDIAKIDEKILEERSTLGFLHGMITQTGRDLVSSVKSCLDYIGFEKVQDVDEEIEKQNYSSQKQEDLQISDNSPTLLIEIKGLSGLPRESDTMQVVKYVPRRMKEWDRTDVRGVSIINHQRNIPPLERDNENVFTKQQIEDAEHQDITILTTWDLFLLARGRLKWGWDPRTIQDLFFKKGKMSRFPTIYRPVGKIYHYWDKSSVVGIEISDNKLQKGDRIGYVIPDRFLEEEVTSLEIDSHKVKEGVPDQNVGMKTIYSKNFLRKGIMVYAYRPS